MISLGLHGVTDIKIKKFEKMECGTFTNKIIFHFDNGIERGKYEIDLFSYKDLNEKLKVSK